MPSISRCQGLWVWPNAITSPGFAVGCRAGVAPPLPPTGIYLIRAEQRFGDGDGIYTIQEQSAAINALYDVARGEHQHLGVGRRARIGFRIDF